MADSSVLRQDAARCSSAASRIRELATALPYGAAAVRRRHPVEAVWAGPNADTFSDGINTASRQMQGAVQNALAYADALTRRSQQLEQQATDEERHRLAALHGGH